LKIASFLGVRAPRAVLAAAAVALGLSAIAIRSLRTDNSLEAWLSADEGAREEFEAFRRRFGSEEFVAVSLEVDDPLALAALEEIDRLTQGIASVPGVGDVLSLARIARDLPPGTWPPGEADRERLARYARESALAGGLLIARSGRATGIWATIEPRPDAPRAAIVSRIRAVLAGMRPPVRASHIVGPPVLNAALDAASRESLSFHLPLIILIAAAVAFALAGDLALLAAILIPPAVPVGIALGTFAAFGFRMDLVTSILPALLFVIAESASIHVAMRFREAIERGRPAREAVEEVIGEVLRPLAAVHATTAIGFLSLLTSGIPQIRTLGIFAAWGVAVTHIAILWIGGAILALFGGCTERRMRARGPARWTEAIVRLQRRLAWPCRIGAPAAIVAGALLAPALDVETQMLRYFPAGDPVRLDFEHVEREYPGITSFEVLVTFPEPIRPDDPAHIETIARVERAVAAEPWVGRTLSIAGIARDVGDAAAGALPLHGSASDAVRRLAWSGVLASPPPWLARLLPAYVRDRVARISALSPEMGSDRLRLQLETLRADLARALPDGDIRITGTVPLLVAMQGQLVAGQLRSFGSAFACIVLLLSIAFRSIPFTALAVIPNLFPLAAAVVLLRAIGEPLNAATVTIGSIAIGIVVDNTIHFGHAYRPAVAGGLRPEEAVAQVTRSVGRAMVTSAVVLTAGFSELMLARFGMVAIFGALIAFIIVAALAGDLLVFPALLTLRQARDAGGPRIREGS